MRSLCLLLVASSVACDSMPRVPQVGHQDTAASPEPVMQDTGYVEPALFDTTPLPPKLRSIKVALPSIEITPAAPPPPAVVKDTVRQADGYVIETTYRMTPVVLGVDTLAHPAPPLPSLPYALLGASFSPSVAAQDPYSFTMEGVNPNDIVATLAAVRKAQRFVMLNPMGGAHKNYRSPRTCKPNENPCYPEVFDMNKWMAKLKQYDTPLIRAAVDSAKPYILGMSSMDEPGNTSIKTDAYWGPPGTFTRARVGELCREMNKIFVGVAVGVVQDPRDFDPAGAYTTDCDFSIVQYRSQKDAVLSYIQKTKASLASSPHMHVMYAMNVLHGGTPSTTCKTWGDNPSGKLCPMTAQQILDYGIPLMKASTCGGLNTWRHEPEYNAKPAVAKSLDSLSKIGKTLPAEPCGG